MRFRFTSAARAAAAAALVATVPLRALAVPTVYTDQEAFLLALNDLSVAVETFDTLDAGTTVSSGNTLGSIGYTYAFPSPATLQVTDAFTTTSGSNSLGVQSDAELIAGDEITFAFAPVNAFGLTVITAEDDITGDFVLDGDMFLTVPKLGVSAALSTADRIVFPDPRGGSAVAALFLGIIDTETTFTSAATGFIDDAVGAWVFNVDDITTATVVSAVPAPATPALLALILATLGLRARRLL